MMDKGNVYRFISDEWNLKIFLNLDIFSPDEILDYPLVNNFAKKLGISSIQKVWDFFYHNPLCDAWWSNGLIYVDFLIRDYKVRRVYDDIDLFVIERIIPFGISPADVFDFLKVTSLDEMKYYENEFKNLKFKNLEFKNLDFRECKICKQYFYVSEIVDLLDENHTVCVYCYNNMTLEDRISLEDNDLRKRRIEETWRVLPFDKRKKLLFLVLKKSLKHTSFDHLRVLNDLSSRLSNLDKFYDIKLHLDDENFLILENEVDKLFIVWWRGVENRGISNEA
jgi:hypothetical protein